MKFIDDSQNLRGRLHIIQVLILVMLSVLAVRLYLLQIINGSHYAEVAENQRIRLLPIPAPRGLIFDRNGHLLADSRPIYSIILSREEYYAHYLGVDDRAGFVQAYRRANRTLTSAHLRRADLRELVRTRLPHEHFDLRFRRLAAFTLRELLGELLNMPRAFREPLAQVFHLRAEFIGRRRQSVDVGWRIRDPVI